MKIRCLVVLVVFSFFVAALAQFCIPQLPLAYAQEEDEEDEEPMQAKPNPMETTTRGISRRSSLQKGALKAGALKMKATVVETSEVKEAEGVTTEQGVSTEIVSMPVDPYDAEGASMPIDPLDAKEAGADSKTGASIVTENGVGSVSWDPSDMPVGWDPFDKEANLDSAEMHQ
ncbi:hypothetical protein ACFL2J_03370 [Candidatus Omnitrophota bacterium]